MRIMTNENYIDSNIIVSVKEKIFRRGTKSSWYTFISMEQQTKNFKLSNIKIWWHIG